LSTKPPSGTRDFLPDEIRRREYVIGVVRDVYEKYGFEPLETPAFENIETLLGKYGEEGNKLIFKILKRGEHEHTGEADLALRYDLTVPLARVVAQYQSELPRFFKRYQIQPVWRADRPARGRFREFYQCDIDALGTTSQLVEVEILSAVSEVLQRLGFTDFKIRVNDRRLLAALLTRSGVPPPLQDEALIALDKLDKIGFDGVEREMTARGIPAAAIAALLMVIRRASESPKENAGHAWVLEPVANEAGAQNLSGIITLAEQTAATGKVVVDLSLARGLSYYTGTIIEITVADLAGSLGGGGRYDGLVGMFLGRDVPACGFSLGLERIIVVMTERTMFPADVARGGIDALVTIWSHDTRAESLTLAAELRKSGLRVDVYPEADKLGKQFKYASARHAPFVAILGDDERARGEVGLKDLRSGDQTSVRRGELAAAIRERL
jgi:histidyl-tRNA synthetase